MLQHVPGQAAPWNAASICQLPAAGNRTPLPPHLLLHCVAGAVGLQLAPLRHHGSHHALLLQVLIPAVLAQLHNVVLALPPSVIQVDACRAKGGELLVLPAPAWRLQAGKWHAGSAARHAPFFTGRRALPALESGRRLMAGGWRCETRFGLRHLEEAVKLALISSLEREVCDGAGAAAARAGEAEAAAKGQRIAGSAPSTPLNAQKRPAGITAQVAAAPLLIEGASATCLHRGQAHPGSMLRFN